MKESIIIGALLIFGGVFIILSNLTKILNIVGILVILIGIFLLIINLNKKN
jgi:hypothetical protein